MAYLYLGMLIKDLTADEQASVPAILANVLKQFSPGSTTQPYSPTMMFSQLYSSAFINASQRADMLNHLKVGLAITPFQKTNTGWNSI